MGAGAKILSGRVRADMDRLRAQTLFGHNMCLILSLGIGR